MAFDPMMMLMSGVQGFADNLGAAQRGEPVQQSGGMREFVPMMAMMQRGQAANAEMELERQKFAAEQQALQQQMQEDVAAAKHLNVPVEVLRLARQKMGEEYAERLGAQTVGANDRLYFGGQQVVGALPEATPSGWADREAMQYVRDPAMHADAMARGQAGATRVLNQTNVTGNKMAEGVAASAVKPFDRLTEAAAAANSRMEATRALYETAKLYPDLIGPGMELKAGVADMIEKAKELADLGQVDPNNQRLLTVARVMEETRGKATTQVMRDLTGNDTDTEWLRTIRQFPGMDDTKLTHDMMFVRAKTESDYLNQKQAHVARRVAEAEANNTFGLTTVSSAEREFEQANPLGDQYAKNLAAVLPPSGAAQPRQEMSAPQGAEPPPAPRGGGLSISPDVEARMRARGY